MQTLSEIEIIGLIQSGELFEAQLADGSLVLKIERYQPAVCTAIHNGSRLREELEERCALSQSERYFEEDPFTGELIGSMPITLIAQDSRYEYDLNRPISQAIYKKAWGKNVWTKRPTEQQQRRSYDKHRCFYRILDALVDYLEKRFKSCLVFDLHSYNYQRIGPQAPTFNLGVEQVDLDRWHKVLLKFEQHLKQITLPNLPIRATRNEVFYGRGYLIAHLNSRFENTLVLPTEIKKIYMDELNGEPYPMVLSALKQGLQKAFSECGAYFSRQHTTKVSTSRTDVLSNHLDPVIIKTDRMLYKLVNGLETLHYINPVNVMQEKKKFFASHYQYQPVFNYRQLKIDPFLFRESLYRLPVDQIRDASVQHLYRQVIDSISEKIDLLVSIGTPQFFYNSLRYYSEPSERDLANARFLLYAPKIETETPEVASIDALQMQGYLKGEAEKWGLHCKIELSQKIVAAAMVSNAKKTLMIRKDVKVSQLELEALAHHELGVHMVTTLNALEQPLKVFSLGLPTNTLTQEGLAILSEYLAGSMSLRRLKSLSLRVLAVEQMIRYGDFRRTFLFLHEEHHVSAEDAFRITLRVHRGGGFTKDHLYLHGLREALNLYQKEDIAPLFIGKTGFAFLPIIRDLIDREILKKPRWLPPALDLPQRPSPVLDYLIQAIR